MIDIFNSIGVGLLTLFTQVFLVVIVFKIILNFVKNYDDR